MISSEVEMLSQIAFNIRDLNESSERIATALELIFVNSKAQSRIMAETQGDLWSRNHKAQWLSLNKEVTEEGEKRHNE